VVLDARGEAIIFWKGAYKVVLKDSLENTIWSIDGVATTDPSNTTSDMIGYEDDTVQSVLDNAKPMANYTALRNYTGRATGARITQSGLAGFFQRDDGDTTSADNGGTVIVDASGRRWKRLFAGYVNAKWFGALGIGTDDTEPLQRAINAVFANGGGTLLLQKGHYLTTGLALDWGSSEVSIRFVGEGKVATTIEKTGASASPVFNLNAVIAGGNSSEFADFQVIGTAACNGFTVTNLARNVWRNVRASNCNIGFENQGSLISTFYDTDFLRNVTGYRARKNLGIYCNLIQMFGGFSNGNTAWGFDIGDTNGLHLYGVDIEQNGTGATGGGFLTRSTCDDEIGYSMISLNGVWFEGNNGVSISAEPCAGLTLSVRDAPVLSGQANGAIVVGPIGSLVLERIVSSSPGSNVVSVANSLVIKESTIGVIDHTGTSSVYENVKTSTGTISYLNATTEGGFRVDGPAINSLNGTVSVPNGTPTKIFSPADTWGLYEVFAVLVGVGAGATYMATARIGWDGVATARVGGENGSALSITTSGADVLVTQTSGITQPISFVCQKIGT
jgi:hypothetical protein